jgi:hypothetical protein
MHNGFQLGLVEHPSQLKNMIESPTPKPFAGVVLRML